MIVKNILKGRNEFAKKHIDKSLRRRLNMFIVIFVALLGFILYDVVTHDFNPFLIIGGFVFGLAVGYAAGRMFHISWHEETAKVVARLDRIGIIILILYIGFSIARRWIFGLWLHGPVLTAFTFTFATGAILGRIMMMSKNIKSVLSGQGIYNDKKAGRAS
ncbi:MAG: hypothetical protein V4665_02955 [Patescibacteria group bacterium]